MYAKESIRLMNFKKFLFEREGTMNKSGYASECTECGSREIKKGEPKNSINVKTMSEVTFRILNAKIVDTKNVKTLTDFKIKSLVKSK